ncbi:MAG: ORF6N domain-containing protein [Elusimicrobiota bacterium]
MIGGDTNPSPFSLKYTKRLNEQVKRNIKRFPGDFMFRLNKKELKSLRSQIGDGLVNSVDN